MFLVPLAIALFACSGGSESETSSALNSFAKGEAVAVVQTLLAQRHVNSIGGLNHVSDCLGLHVSMDGNTNGVWTEHPSSEFTDVKHELNNGILWVWRVFPTTGAVSWLEFNITEFQRVSSSEATQSEMVLAFSGC